MNNNHGMDLKEQKKEFVTIDWLVKILLSLVAFFLAVTYFTVEQTAKDVSDMKYQIETIQSQYNQLNKRVNDLELNSKK